MSRHYVIIISIIIISTKILWINVAPKLKYLIILARKIGELEKCGIRNLGIDTWHQEFINLPEPNMNCIFSV
jgi:hypothetical protein